TDVLSVIYCRGPLIDLSLKTWRPKSPRPTVGMALFCTYEATFINVKEPKPGTRSKSAGANAPRPPCTKTSYVETLEKRASALAFLEPERSEGSLGHPEFCFKPCLYVAYGACPSGATCSFCHLPHKQAKLRRRDRELLGQLGEAELLALILPYLRAKKIPGTDPLLGLMEAHLASLPSTSAQIRGLAKLGGSLRRLSFRQLVLLSRGLDVPGVQAALAALRSGI
ncbi:unnamed protein product, partial [Effrenium voratum]